MSVTETIRGRPVDAAGRWWRRGNAIVLVEPPPEEGVLEQELPSQASTMLVGFRFNDEKLQPSHRRQVEDVARKVIASLASERPARTIRIVGHTDRVGSDAYNHALGLRRANLVAHILRTAIDAQSRGASARLRFDVTSRGESEPVPGGRERNRRVEVFVATADLPTPSKPKPPAPPRRPRGGGGQGRAPGLAKEHVIIVGAPSNFYNGFGRFDASGTLVLNPAPNDLAGVRDFSHEDLGNVTHDRYWANFIEPVPRLFTRGIAKPTDGDVVTILVFWPPYAERSSRDWDVSPWNTLVWRNSPWVAGKDPYDPMVRLTQQGTLSPRSVPTTPRASTKPNLAFVKQPASEARIDHEILMRCTTEAKRRGQTYDMRPSRADEWMDDLHDLARRIVFGPMLGGKAVLPAVLVKLLIVDDPKQILEYLAKGTFPSKDRWTHVLDTRNEEDMASVAGPSVTSRDGQWWDAAAAGKKGFKPPAWWTAPHISRKQVSVKRLDYIGHSNQDALFLKYGWANKKGDPAGPVGEVLITTAEIDAALKAAPQPVFSNSAVAHLWGCSLGLGMAPTLSNHVGTIAAEVLTDYEGLVLDPKAMPSPIGGGWITYVKPITVRATR
jgi:outer membrane protein OmpA-like peptidoglycan-associated protein